MPIIHVIRTHDDRLEEIKREAAMLRDGNLSLKAKGLLVYLRRLPQGWKFDPKKPPRDHLEEGRDSIYAAIKELISAGYIEPERDRNGHGHLTNTIYHVYDRPTRDGYLPGFEDLAGEPVAVGGEIVNMAREKRYLDNLDDDETPEIVF